MIREPEPIRTQNSALVITLKGSGKWGEGGVGKGRGREGRRCNLCETGRIVENINSYSLLIHIR
jgi:hypothetical protein